MDWEIIYSYTREQAVADGVLIDVTDFAKRNGFKCPVAVTDHLYHRYVVPQADELKFAGQSTEGRLHDLLMLTYFKAVAGTEDFVQFNVSFLMEPDKHEIVECWAKIGPGDLGEPVVTIMLPGDD